MLLGVISFSYFHLQIILWYNFAGRNTLYNLSFQILNFYFVSNKMCVLGSTSSWWRKKQECTALFNTMTLLFLVLRFRNGAEVKASVTFAMTAEQLSFHLYAWISSPETRSRFKAKDTAQVVEGGQCSPGVDLPSRQHAPLLTGNRKIRRSPFLNSHRTFGEYRPVFHTWANLLIILLYNTTQFFLSSFNVKTFSYLPLSFF